MKFVAAVVALLATGVSASGKPHDGGHSGKNVTYTTVVVDEYKTYCPEPTTLTWSDKTYSVTEATTLTLKGPVTVTKPVYTSAVVYCDDCKSANSTSKSPAAPTGSSVTAGADKVIAVTGAGLAGLLAIALAL